ncbi:hypothetical protein HHI36_005123 [Cryptolaemus montrouzieri]|uniref:Uncharacterized protein n=1 Tax=Cryptolaemus montrouzieri TaxID=559131 RepID=A0ABD2NTF9_9CUCU
MKNIHELSFRYEKAEDFNIAKENTNYVFQTVSALTHSSPKLLAETCLSKILTSNRNLASGQLDLIYPDNSVHDTNENDSFPDLSLSTLHLSGSCVDVDSVVSLDDVLIVPVQDIASSPTMSNVQK